MAPAPIRRLNSGPAQPVYCLYGIRVTSQWPLRCSHESEPNRPDVELRKAAGTLSPPGDRADVAGSDSGGRFQYAALPDGSTYVRWSGLFEFVVSPEGHQVACWPLPNATPAALETYLLGQVLSFALIRRGVEPLHSTAVVIGGQAVGLMGDCGYGKSTLAASFLQAGYPLLTDDLLVAEKKGDRYIVHPGMPRIKLFPEVARSLLGEGVRGRPMNNTTPKLVIPLAGRQRHAAPAPLRALYVIRPPRSGRPRKRVTIRRLSQRQAFLELTRNTFNSRVTDPERLKRQFLFATTLAHEIPVKSISYPRDISVLPSVREAILRDLQK